MKPAPKWLGVLFLSLALTAVAVVVAGNLLERYVWGERWVPLASAPNARAEIELNHIERHGAVGSARMMIAYTSGREVLFAGDFNCVTREFQPHGIAIPSPPDPPPHVVESGSFEEAALKYVCRS